MNEETHRLAKSGYKGMVNCVRRDDMVLGKKMKALFTKEQ